VPGTDVCHRPEADRLHQYLRRAGRGLRAERGGDLPHARRLFLIEGAPHAAVGRTVTGHSVTGHSVTR